jgi:hypothetical protein
VGHAVFLKAEAYSVFLPFLEERDPVLAAKYRLHFSDRARLPGDYTERLARKIREAREAAGLTERDRGEEWRPQGPQLELEF